MVRSLSTLQNYLALQVFCTFPQDFNIGNTLRDLVPYVKFKKREKNTHGGVIL